MLLRSRPKFRRAAEETNCFAGATRRADYQKTCDGKVEAARLLGRCKKRGDARCNPTQCSCAMGIWPRGMPRPYNWGAREGVVRLAAVGGPNFSRGSESYDPLMRRSPDGALFGKKEKRRNAQTH